MSRRFALAPILPFAFFALACQPPEQPAQKGDGKGDDKGAVAVGDAAKGDGNKVETAPSQPAPGPATASTPAADGDAREAAPPPWFDESLYGEAKVMRKDRSEVKLAGGYASALVLQLADGTSIEQCMQSALTEIGKDVGKSVAELPQPDVGADRQTVHGTDNGYDWTVVCGDAKGKPTMYLSYTRS